METWISSAESEFSFQDFGKGMLLFSVFLVLVAFFCVGVGVSWFQEKYGPQLASRWGAFQKLLRP